MKDFDTVHYAHIQALSDDELRADLALLEKQREGESDTDNWYLLPVHPVYCLYRHELVERAPQPALTPTPRDDAEDLPF